MVVVLFGPFSMVVNGGDKMCDIFETAGHRAKRTKIWASGASILCIQGTFDCQVLKFSLGSFGAFPFFDDLVSRKLLVVERDGPKFGPLGQVMYIQYF